MHPIDVKQLNTAGKAARISAVLGLFALLLFYFKPELDENWGSSTPDTLLLIITFTGVGLLILVYKTFQSYLNQRFGFHEIDSLINLLIWLNIIGALISFLDTLFLRPAEPDTGGWPPGLLAIVICAVFIGLVMVVLASRVFRLQDDLFGMLKPYYICMMVAGICTAAVFTIPIAAVFSAASDYILSKVFFRAANQMQEEQTNGQTPG